MPRNDPEIFGSAYSGDSKPYAIKISVINQLVRDVDSGILISERGSRNNSTFLIRCDIGSSDERSCQ
ncbi:hypothetical protein D3C78_1742450 [compost metagenome]